MLIVKHQRGITRCCNLLLGRAFVSDTPFTTYCRSSNFGFAHTHLAQILLKSDNFLVLFLGKQKGGN